MIYFVVPALLGLVPAFIASKKGYSFGLWWLYGALIFIVAIIHALLIKPKSLEAKKKLEFAHGQKRCLYCAELIHLEARVCKHCGRDVVNIPSDGSIPAPLPKV